MDVDDPFAGDLNSFDAVIAQLTRDKDIQPHLPAQSSGTTTASVATLQTHSTGLEGEGHRGRRGVLLFKDSGRRERAEQVKFGLLPRGSKAVVSDDTPMPWDIDSTTQQSHHLAASAVRQQGLPALSADNVDIDENDDPLAFLDKGLSLKAGVAAPNAAVSHIGACVAVPGQQEHWERDEEERRDLLSSIDAVGIELSELQNTLETLQIKADTELTHLGTKIIEKQTELASQVDNAANERREYEAYNQRRLKEVAERTLELIRQQEEEVTAIERERHEGQLRVLSAAVADVQARVDQLSQQRELLLREHKYDEKGIFLALSEEEMKEKGKGSEEIVLASGSNDAATSKSGSVVDAKLDAALQLLWRHHMDNLMSFSNNVVQYIHQETMDVAREVRERHGIACLEDVINQKEEFSKFLQEFLQRYREFFGRRVELRSRNMALLRRGLQEASAQLRLHSEKRLERRMREVTANIDELTQRFGKLTVESIKKVLDKALVLREGDESVARSQLEDLKHRCQAEQLVTEKLQCSEVEILQKRLCRMRQCDNKQRSANENVTDRSGDVTVSLQQQVSQGICTAMAESITSKVHELELVVQQRLLEQLSRNKSCRAEGGNLFLTDEGLTVRMAIQEKGAVIASLLEDVKSRQTELLSTRLRCGELREQIAAALQEEVQTVRQQRLTQEANIANNELLRISWEKEQRELLKWGNEMMLSSGEHSKLTTTAKTQLPTATATVDILNLLAERNSVLVENRAKLSAELQKLFYTMIKEHDKVLAERREVELRWVRLCEQLVDLIEKHEVAAARRGAATVELAKLEVSMELLTNDKELFHHRRGEVEGEVNRLKRELQETLAEMAGNPREQLALVEKEEAVVGAGGASSQRVLGAASAV